MRVRLAGTDRWQTFGEAFGTTSDSKFSNVRLHRGDTILLQTPSGGGYGPPHERHADRVAADVAEGFVSPEAALHDYDVVIGADGAVDEAATRKRRQ